MTPIYLDHQASTPCAPEVVQAMAPYWSMEFGNPHSSAHAFGWRADDAVSTARGRIAEMIGAEAHEIIFTSGATEANNLALVGLLGHEAPNGRNVVVSAIEHKCVLEASRELSRRGFEIRKAPVKSTGHIDLDRLGKLVDRRTALVSLMLVNNEIGAIQPVRAVSRLCGDAGAVLHCDAAQAPTGVSVDVAELGVDLLSLSSHKMYGPKGIGALFVSHAVRFRMRPIMHGGGQEGGLRSGTLPVTLCVGFGQAARLTRERLSSDVIKLSELRRAFFDALSAKACYAEINGSEPRHPGQINLRMPGIDAEMLVANLQPRIALSTGAACASGIPEPSHVLRAIGLDGDAAKQSVRIGLGRLNDMKAVIDAAHAIAQEVGRIQAGLKLPSVTRADT